jgi:hypothetical protein
MSSNNHCGWKAAVNHGQHSEMEGDARQGHRHAVVAERVPTVCQGAQSVYERSQGWRIILTAFTGVLDKETPIRQYLSE